MPGKSNKPEQSPADIAREAFRRLAAQRIAPTPDAYRDIYDEIAGKPQGGAEKVLSDFAAELAAVSESAAAVSADIARALARRDWETCTRRLTELVEGQLRNVVAQAAPAESAEPVPALAPVSVPPVAEATLEKPPRRAQPFPLVDDAPAAAPAPLPPPAPRASLAPEPDAGRDAALRDLLARALSIGIASLLRAAPELAEEAEKLAAAVRDPAQASRHDEIAARLKQLCFKIEMRSEDMAEEHELLLRLFRLLLDNVGELLEDDSWLSGQIESVQELLSGPISHNALEDATRSLKEVIYKQGALKHSLVEAKVTLKNMMITFIDRLGEIATSTGDYHKKIDQYSQKISQARGITELSSVLEDVMRDTRIAQTDALRSRDDMLAARKDVQEAEEKIVHLEAKLEQMSELVREDKLTGSLNRRGLEDVLEREFARSERRASPLCIALLDLDDFKRLNDIYGHNAGDEALVHLVRVVKDTLRTMDVIGRFGGEEFLVVLPDTTVEIAIQTVTRLQRELTKRIFMHENAKLLMTFSAGVALRAPGEDQACLIKRADEALYKAKKAGKNRVAAAD
jgi:diguanylate cyclase